MANIYKHRPGFYTISRIQSMTSSHALKSVQVEVDDNNPNVDQYVWLLFDGVDSVGAYGWVELDDAEAIGLAILDAVRVARGELDDG